MGGYYYPDQFTYEVETVPEMTGVLGIFVVLYLLIMFFSFAFTVVSYVFYSLGLYTIADRRGIRNGWLAWIPLGNLWILGCISDQYQYVAKGKVKNRRKLLLGLAIGLVVVYVGWIITMVMSLILSEGIVSGASMIVLFAILGVLAFAALVITVLVYEFVCLYDLYHSCNPSNAVLFLVLSILFSVTMPFFIFACRKKDLGMPPRKQPAAESVVIPTVEPVVDPAVVEKVVIPTVEPVVDPTVVEQVVIPTVEPVTEEGFAQPEEFEDE